MVQHRRRRLATPRFSLDAFARTRKTYDIKGEIEAAIDSKVLHFADCAMSRITARVRQLEKATSGSNHHQCWEWSVGIEHCARLLVQYFNDRMAWVWTIRDDSFRLAAIASLFRELVDCVVRTETASNTLQGTGHLNLLLAPLKWLQFYITEVFQVNLTYILRYYIRRSVHTHLGSVFQGSKDEFCRLKTDWKFVFVFACQKISPAHDRSESELCNILRESGIDPIVEAIQKVASSGQLECFRGLISSAVNATLDTLLNTILQQQLQFDESGLYKFYRLLLKLQECVDELKRRLDLARDEHLILDLTSWKRAQYAINQINDAIFQRNTLHQTSDKGRLMRTSDWQQLVNQSNDGLLTKWLQQVRQWQKRHKGTVFVSLTLDLNNF